MRLNNDHTNFEQYLQDIAAQHRMMPSDKVWDKVHTRLHPKRHWYNWSLAGLFLLTALSVTLVMSLYPVVENNKMVPKQKAMAQVKPNLHKANMPTLTDFVAMENKLSEAPSLAVNAEVKPALWSQENEFKPSDAVLPVGVLAKENIEVPTLAIESRLAKGHNFETVTPSFEVNTAKLATIVQSSNYNYLQNIEQPIKPAENAPITYAESELTAVEDLEKGYKAPRKKLKWQLFVTPTISYRSLKEDKKYDLSLVDNPASYNMKDIIFHKPEMGLALGVIGKYKINKYFNARIGAQFNISRYDIKAYVNRNTEVATINLNGNDGQDRINTLTNYRVRGYANTDWLKNLYYSISLPIGVEMNIPKDARHGFGLAVNVMPTGVLVDRAYVISSDLKNYAQVPNLVRKTNISSNVEAYISLKNKNSEWQIGPQVRYQHLSSFKKPYPVKENLFDIGLKIGYTFK